MIDTLLSFFELGGPVVFLLFIVAVTLFSLLANRFLFVFTDAKVEHDAALQEIKKLGSFESRNRAIKNMYLHDVKTSLFRNFKLIQILIVICPVLGLLGTVTGMIQVFDVVAVLGTGNARALASGITMATLPTMVGMTVSIIGLLLFALLNNLSQKYTIS